MEYKIEMISKMEYFLKLREMGVSHINECKSMMLSLDKFKNYHKSKKLLNDDLNYTKIHYVYQLDLFSIFMKKNNISLDINYIIQIINELEKNNSPKKITKVQKLLSVEFTRIFNEFTHHCDSIEPPLAEW